MIHRLSSRDCCCDHCLASHFTAFHRGTAVATTAFRHISPPFTAVLLLRSQRKTLDAAWLAIDETAILLTPPLYHCRRTC